MLTVLAKGWKQILTWATKEKLEALPKSSWRYLTLLSGKNVAELVNARHELHHFNQRSENPCDISTLSLTVILLDRRKARSSDIYSTRETGHLSCSAYQQLSGEPSATLSPGLYLQVLLKTLNIMVMESTINF